MAQEKLNNLEKRIQQLEKDVVELRKKTVRLVHRRKMSLKEKFRLHDHMKGLKLQFETQLLELPVYIKDTKIKELREIFKALCNLVDTCLGQIP